MADFCVDNTQQVEFDEKVVCGLWQCEALRASQKPIILWAIIIYACPTVNDIQIIIEVGT